MIRIKAAETRIFSPDHCIPFEARPVHSWRGGMKVYRDILPIVSPCGEPFFCEERLNLARKGRSDTHLAMWLLSAMLSTVCLLASTGLTPLHLFNPEP